MFRVLRGDKFRRIGPGFGIIGDVYGEMPERLNGTVSKTVVGLVPTVGSNPTLSAESPPAHTRAGSFFMDGEKDYCESIECSNEANILIIKG